LIYIELTENLIKNVIVMTIFNILLYGGITIIIIGLIMYFVADYMVKYYDKQIKKHTFEIVQPKIKKKK